MLYCPFPTFVDKVSVGSAGTTKCFEYCYLPLEKSSILLDEVKNNIEFLLMGKGVSGGRGRVVERDIIYVDTLIFFC